MQNLIKKAFNIHEGEIRIAFLMQLYIFLVITVLLLVKPTVTALFLSELGVEKLPYGYLLVATVALASTLFYNKLVERYSIKMVAISTIVLFSIFFFVLGYLLLREVVFAPVLYFYYLSLSLFGVLVTSQFWIISNLVFDAREAKRLFGFIGAGAIAGGIAGGYLTTLLSTYFGNSTVIFVASGLLLLCLPIIFTVWHLRINTLSQLLKEKRRAKEKSASGPAFKIVFRSRHLSYLAAMVGVGVLVAKLVDYQFSDFSQKAFSDPQDLASFFGFWFSTFNVTALLVQLFLTNRLLSYLGVTTNLLILPVGIAVGCILFLTFPELWVLVLIKGMDGSFKQSVNKASFELSILPIDFNTKKRAKPFIDVVVDSLATGIAGCLLLLVIDKFEVSTNYISVIIIFFLFVWLIIIYKLRETYFDTFRKNIRSYLAQEKSSDKTIESISKSNIEVLSKGKEKEILLLLSHLPVNIQDYFKPHILKLLDHPSNRVKAAAIREIYHFKYGTATEKMIEILNTNEDDEVIYEAMNYILLHTSVKKDSRIFLTYLDHEKSYIKNAALLCLANVASHNKVLARKFKLDQRIQDHIRDIDSVERIHRRAAITELLLTIGKSKSSQYYYFIGKYLESKEEILVRNAIKSAGHTLDETYLPKLMSLMKEDRYRSECIGALQNYGEAVCTLILKHLKSGEIDDRVKLHIPEVIEPFKTRQSGRILKRLLESRNVKVRLEAARCLAKIEDKIPRFKMNKKDLNRLVLKGCDSLTQIMSAKHALEKSLNMASGKKLENDAEIKRSSARERLIERLDQNFADCLETMFLILSLRYRNSDMAVAFMGIRNNTLESRTNSIEFLDNLLEMNLKKNFLPLLEYHFLNDRDMPVPFKIKSETESLNELLPNSDENIAFYISELSPKGSSQDLKSENEN